MSYPEMLSLSLTMIVDGGGTIPLGNNQIHSATYGFQTDVRTYHLWQMTANAHAQVKADEIGESKWDAVNGVHCACMASLVNPLFLVYRDVPVLLLFGSGFWSIVLDGGLTN